MKRSSNNELPLTFGSLGEVVGHWLHDTIAGFLTKRSNEGKLEPEYRLMAITISTPFMLTGLVVLGFALENAWHYMIAALGWYADAHAPTSAK